MKKTLEVEFTNPLCEKFKFIEVGQSPILVPEDSSIELKQRLLAAYLSYHMGLKSIDRVLKQYGPVWDQVNEKWSSEINQKEVGSYSVSWCL